MGEATFEEPRWVERYRWVLRICTAVLFVTAVAFAIAVLQGTTNTTPFTAVFVAVSLIAMVVTLDAMRRVHAQPSLSAILRKAEEAAAEEEYRRRGL